MGCELRLRDLLQHVVILGIVLADDVGELGGAALLLVLLPVVRLFAKLLRHLRKLLEPRRKLLFRRVEVLGHGGDALVGLLADEHGGVLGALLELLHLAQRALLLHLILDLHLANLVGDDLRVGGVRAGGLEALDALAGLAQDALNLVLVLRRLLTQIVRRLLALGVEVVDDLRQLLDLAIHALERGARAAGLRHAQAASAQALAASIRSLRLSKHALGSVSKRP